MEGTEKVIYERVYNVSGRHASEYLSDDFATPVEAGARVAELLALGAYSISAWQSDREVKPDAE